LNAKNKKAVISDGFFVLCPLYVRRLIFFSVMRRKLALNRLLRAARCGNRVRQKKYMARKIIRSEAMDLLPTL
jgi:hypothetical protein